MIGPQRSFPRLTLPGYGEVLRSRYASLLLAIAALFVLSPLLESALQDRILYALLTLAVLIAAIRASTQARSPMRRIAVGIGAIWVVLVAVKVAWPGKAQMVAVDLLFLAFSTFTLGVVLGRVLSAKRVDFDILSGTAAAYLLLALTWAISYGLIEVVAPGAFSGTVRADFPEFLYFSLTTITSLGYGDILPVNPWARVWAGLQAAVGIFYMAAVVARLVSAYER